MRTVKIAAGAAQLFALVSLLAASVALQPARTAHAAPTIVTVATAPAAASLTQKVILPETSIDGPTLTGSTLGRSALAWTGTDARHRLNVMTTTDDVHFSNKRTLVETSPFRPAIAQAAGNASDREFGPFVVVAWTGTDAAHTLNVLWNVYGAAGSPQKKLTLRGETSIGPPGLAVQDRLGQLPLLDLAWTGTDANHSLNVLPLAAETLAPGSKMVLRQFSSDAGPNLAIGSAVASQSAEWVLSWTGRAQRLNLATSLDGTHFTLRANPTLQAERSAAAPSAEVVDAPQPGSAPSCLAWTGLDSAHHLNLRSTTDFPRWTGPKTVLADTGLGGVQIAPTTVVNLIAWTGTDAAHHVNVAQIEGC